MNEDILNTKIQKFINDHLNDDPAKLILKGSPFQNVKIQTIVEQIIAKKKCKKKLPIWFNSEVYYPNKLNIEQTSSEITAKYKSTLVSGNTLIDITGGYGVDCFYFAKVIENITHCEINENLSKIVAYNYKKMRLENVHTYCGNGFDYLDKINQKFDWIYVDPSRRNDVKEKVFLLEDCLPNIPEKLDLLYQYSNNLLLKTSPLLDLSATIKALKFVKEIHIIAVNNDVKELLFILQKDYEKSIHIKTINIKKESTETFESVLNHGAIATLSLPKSYLFEPNSSILKAGLFNHISEKLGIDKLHNNSHLYTSNDPVKFPGRRFKIIQISTYNKKYLSKIIPSKKANITTRNFPQTVAQIRKKIGFKDGGDHYLFFTTDISNKHIVLVCEKI